MSKDPGVVVETDLFEHRKVGANFINPCCFGEDFAGWLRERLADPQLELSAPIQEDYGWGFWARRGKERCWIALSYMGDGPQEEPAQWMVSAAAARGPLGGLFGKRSTLEPQISARLAQVLSGEPGINVLD